MKLYLQRALLTDCAVEVEIGVLTETFDTILKEFAETFRSLVSNENQNVLAEWRLELAEAGILGKLAHVGVKLPRRPHDRLQRADQAVMQEPRTSGRCWQAGKSARGWHPDAPQQPYTEPPRPSSSRLQELAGSRDTVMITGNEPGPAIISPIRQSDHSLSRAPGYVTGF